MESTSNRCVSYAAYLGLPHRTCKAKQTTPSTKKRPGKGQGKAATARKTTVTGQGFAHLLKAARARAKQADSTGTSTTTSSTPGRRLTPEARRILAAHQRATGQKPRP